MMKAKEKGENDTVHLEQNIFALSYDFIFIIFSVMKLVRCIFRCSLPDKIGNIYF